jgi:hypothetical protein
MTAGVPSGIDRAWQKVHHRRQPQPPDCRRILTKRVREISEESECSLASEVGRQTLTVSRSALPEISILVHCLVEASVDSDGKKRNRINRVLNKQTEFMS